MASILHIIAVKLRAHRRRLGFSQEELAERSGLHRTYVGAIERGERNLTILNLEKLAMALRVDVQELLSTDTSSEEYNDD